MTQRIRIAWLLCAVVVAALAGLTPHTGWQPVAAQQKKEQKKDQKKGDEKQQPKKKDDEIETIR
ncbi:MAG: hypothetical protein HYR56_01750, partial [Acidobacteria bacterium]|nr:hypothetical protein [Acidobacteriota bacterium]